MGCPYSIGKDFFCSSNRNLYTLRGCPKFVGGIFDAAGTPVVNVVHIFPSEQVLKEDTRGHNRYYNSSNKKILEVWSAFDPIQEVGGRWVIDDKRMRELYWYVTDKDYQGKFKFKEYTIV
jgi:hypothetical protein